MPLSFAYSCDFFLFSAEFCQMRLSDEFERAKSLHVVQVGNN